MKFVKIISAVLFFSFVGNFHNQLFAQEPTKNLGRWTRILTVDEYLEKGDYRAKVQDNGQGKSIELIIYKSDDGVVVRSIFLHKSFSGFEGIGFKKVGNDMTFVCLKKDDTSDKSGAMLIGELAASKREESFGSRTGFTVVNADKAVLPSCYFQLRLDGSFVIISCSTALGFAAGDDILSL